MNNHPPANLPFEPWHPEGTEPPASPDYYFATIGELRGEVVRLCRCDEDEEDRWVWSIVLMTIDADYGENWVLLKDSRETYPSADLAMNAANEAYRKMFGLA